MRARKQAAFALIADLSTEQVNALGQLFDDAGGMSQLALVKTMPIDEHGCGRHTWYDR